jgi:probable phosphoglycerate mutase
MQARAVAELDAIVAAHPAEMVVVVSHADVIKAAVAHYIGLHLDLFQRLAVSPASLNVLVFALTESRFVRLVCLNDVAHASPEGAASRPASQPGSED